MKNYCTSWTGKHNYQPRYDELPHDFAKDQLEANSFAAPKREDSIRKIYVRDICLYCGHTIERLNTDGKLPTGDKSNSA